MGAPPATVEGITTACAAKTFRSPNLNPEPLKASARQSECLHFPKDAAVLQARVGVCVALETQILRRLRRPGRQGSGGRRCEDGRHSRCGLHARAQGELRLAWGLGYNWVQLGTTTRFAVERGVGA